MTSFLDIVTTLCIGLLIGTEFTVSAFINPILNQLDGRAQAGATRLFAKKLGTAMPFWYSASLLLLIAAAVMHRQQSGSALLIAASVIWAAAIVLSTTVLVPINNRIMRFGGDEFPAEARREHRKWDALHRLRVVALAAAMGCFLVAVHV
jgi:uncharacterized membrane protein